MSQNCLQHTDKLRPFFVDGRRVEVINFNIRGRPDRVRKRSSILWELPRPERSYVLDTLHGAKPDIFRKFLIAEDREAFLEAELKPITQGNPVARPIVEIFMRDNRLYKLIVRICRCRRIREYVFIVEYIEALVLHRAHVEVADCDDHVDIKVVFEAEPLLVPAHRLL